MAETDAIAMEEELCSDTSRWGPDPAPVVEPAHVAVASLEASGKHCDATLNCCSMQCSETTHSFLHHLDFQEKSNPLTGLANVDMPTMMPSGLMTSVDLHSLMCNECSLKLATKSAPVKLLSDSICLKYKQKWQESLETFVSLMIESFFIDLESDFPGAYVMQNLFLASDVEVAKIPLCGLVETTLTQT